jgi:hypothetical protein
MTAILPLKDVGDPMKPEGDIFSAEDLNKIYRAMKYVLGIETDVQASIRPDTIYIGTDKTAGLKRDPDTGQLVIFDSLAGHVKLANLGAANFACPPYLGEVTGGGGHAAITADRMYLRYVQALRDDTLSQIVFSLWSTSGTLGNVRAAVYNPAGDLLASSVSTAVTYATGWNVAVPLDAPLTLAAGDKLYLGLIFSGGTWPLSGNSVGGHNAKYVDVGSFTVPDPLTANTPVVPAAFATVFVPGFIGRVAAGVPLI